MTLLAVPNVSEGRERATIRSVGEAFASAGAQLLDVHTDPDHNRSVFTLAGEPGALSAGLLAGGREALARIDLRTQRGAHPRVGALDVAPVVHLDAGGRGAACAEALVAADLLGRELGLPVYLYGALGGGRLRSDLRRGGTEELARRTAAGELAPDFGPPEPHPTGGATLVAARPLLVAFNVELGPPATLDDARAAAAAIREGAPQGLTGVRAIGVPLESRGIVQVSVNIEDPETVSLADVVAAVRRRGAVAAAELVGLAPRAALAGFPDDVPLRGFDASRHVIENSLGL